jgi:hypothetical protein
MIAGIILTLICIGYRVALGCFGSGEWWFNFAPISAIALCGAIYFPRKLALALPFFALLLSDLILNEKFGAPLVSWEMGMRYLALGAISVGGFALRGFASRGMVLGTSVVASVWFYLITNSVSWFSSPAYVKSFAGWEQALTTGLPGYPQTWLFFRNSLLSDLLFTALFLACMSFSAARKPAALGSQSAERKPVGA